MNTPQSIVIKFALLLCLPWLSQCGQDPDSQTGASPAIPIGEADNREHENQLLSETRQLITEGARSGEGYFAANGQELIFQSERGDANPFYQIFIKNLKTGVETPVSPGIGKTSCAWIHPTEDRVLFASTHDDPKALSKQAELIEQRQAAVKQRYAWSYDEQYDIYTSQKNGQGLKNLTNTLGYDAEGSYSPDGKQIVFASNRLAYSQTLSADDQAKLSQDPSYFMDLFIMDSEGGNVKQLTTLPGHDGGPFFSNDGKRIVWRHFSEDGQRSEIWIMDQDGQNQTQITQLNTVSWAPYFHPSNEYIIFASTVMGHGNFELYLVDLDGAKIPVRATNTPGFDGLPVFSPTGDQLAWSSTRTANGQAQIFLANWNHQAASALINAAKARVIPSDSAMTQ